MSSSLIFATTFLFLFVFASSSDAAESTIYSPPKHKNPAATAQNVYLGPLIISDDPVHKQLPPSATASPASETPLESPKSDKEYYTDEDFLDALKYASNRFKGCCERKKMESGCIDYVCKYGLDSDYMRSALITQCDMEDPDLFKSFFHCANENMDNYNCCRTFGISQECCSHFMSFENKGPEYSADLFISQCLDVLKAISYCPVTHF